MREASLQLRSIGDLLSERFFVPAYQRGYRWTPLQVEALLNDLLDFQQQERSRDAYYCLQPVVVLRRDDGQWELVDGQQRITTIFLILRALEDIANILKLSRYQIAYETRAGSAEFLQDPSAERSSENIDYHHIYMAYEAIRTWFDSRGGETRLDLVRCLTGRDDTGANVRVIWYDLGATPDPTAVFVRLNVGKIPLTSAELIRALLLRSDLEDMEVRDAQQIAQDWDLIEHRLQDDRYWYFLQSSKTAPPARIEYLFDIFVRVHGDAVPSSSVPDPLRTFLAFGRLLAAAGNPRWSLWQAFKRLAQTLEDWFEDPVSFHLVGFLVTTSAPGDFGLGPRGAEETTLGELLRVRTETTASAFDRGLRRMIWRQFAGQRARDPNDRGFTPEQLAEAVSERLDALTYNSGPVATALLLFNIASVVEQTASTQRFQFDGYKTNAWDIEHVRSVAEYVPRSVADRQRWLTHAGEFLETPAAASRDAAAATELRALIDAQLSASAPDEETFSKVFARVRTLSGEPEARAADDTISNLVLLDMGTNRSYKNAIFPVKRKRIIELDKAGQFVPPATRNVFLKYYSPGAAQLLLWDDNDQAAYAEAIEQVFIRFFSPLLELVGAS